MAVAIAINEHKVAHSHRCLESKVNGQVHRRINGIVGGVVNPRLAVFIRWCLAREEVDDVG